MGIIAHNKVTTTGSASTVFSFNCVRHCVGWGWELGLGSLAALYLDKQPTQVVYPLGLWSRFSGVVKVLYGFG